MRVAYSVPVHMFLDSAPVYMLFVSVLVCSVACCSVCQSGVACSQSLLHTCAACLVPESPACCVCLLYVRCPSLLHAGVAFHCCFVHAGLSFVNAVLSLHIALPLILLAIKFDPCMVSVAVSFSLQAVH